MRLSECLRALADYRRTGEGNPEIDGLTVDSRHVRPGSLFFCIKGHTLDGHRFAAQAVAAGAAAIIAEDSLDVPVPAVYVNDAHRALAMIADYYYGEPSFGLHLIGVTGTNGKTTITYLVQALQSACGLETGLIGTTGARFKNFEADVENTTPEVHLIHRYLAEMKSRGADSVVMETSSNALYDGRVHGCDFNIGIFTNLTEDHLDLHGTMKDYMYAKGLLFAQLGNTYGKSRGIRAAVLNVDDPASDVYRHLTAARVVTYGIEREADVMAEDISIAPSGTSFTLKVKEVRYPFSMRLIGKFNVYNMLASLAACTLAGLPIAQLIATASEIPGVAGRFESVEEKQNFSVIVDYSHTPDSLANALETIKEFAPRRILTVVGCGGDRERTKRPIMAKIAVDSSTVAILTSDNPRTEDPEAILAEMERGVCGKSYVKISDRRAAIRYAVQHAEAGDVILIAGKGHETYQIIGRVKHHFDDREVARTAIREFKSV
ncbi:MAG: UDP-N-acetylmuramoyl-L-alanyl-D-glutamate--2,6-diaminopimelate ligase [Sporolactobacillus sp.]